MSSKFHLNGLYMYRTHMAHIEKFNSRQFALVWSLDFFCYYLKSFFISLMQKMGVYILWFG